MNYSFLLKQLALPQLVEGFRSVLKLMEATFVGKGFLAEIRQLAHEYGAGVVIFDNELSPTQGKKH